MCSFSPRCVRVPIYNSRIVTFTCMHANVTVVIDVLMVVYDQTWENWDMVSLHDQLALDIRPRCWPRVLKLTRPRLIHFEHPRSTSVLNIQHYLIMIQWIALQHLAKLLQTLPLHIPSSIHNWWSCILNCLSLSSSTKDCGQSEDMELCAWHMLKVLKFGKVCWPNI